MSPSLWLLGGDLTQANSLTEFQDKKPVSEQKIAKNTESSPFGGHVHALAVNPLNNELFLGAHPLYHSRDGGKTWNATAIPKSKERANVTSIAIDTQNPQIMYATGHGLSVIKSVDGGKTWQVKAEGLSGDSTEAIAIDVYDSNKLYLSVLGDGLYRSVDAGESWQRISDHPKNQEILL
ncbi:MAG: hypothetical protein IGQ45_05065 [Cyanobacterium sp. T60_A2020_053]|nr:hypothetical protein [Cyanobacterium sp. T60_A2020_053]